MINDAARKVIESSALGHLVTINPDGSPHVTLAWTGMDGDEIVIGTLVDQKKLANMRRDPRVVLSFETGVRNDFGLDEYLIVYGRATIVEGGAPELLRRLTPTYLGEGVSFPPPNSPPGHVTRITVDRIGGMGPWS